MIEQQQWAKERNQTRPQVFVVLDRIYQQNVLEQNDPCLAKILQLISADERCHYDFFRRGVKVFLEHQPRETVDDIKFVFREFYMPAKYELRDYEERARLIARTGVYGPRDYVQRVRDPILGTEQDDVAEGRRSPVGP